jgi:ABC-type Fe3+ transport system permease subunit
MPVGRRPWVLWSGFWFGALYLVGLALTTYDAVPSADEPLSALPVFYSDSGNRILVLAGGVALAAAAPCLLAFTGAATAAASERRAVEASLAPLAASLFAACIAVAAAALALVAGELSFRSVLQPSAQIERWLVELGYAVVLVPGMIAAACLLLALARTLELPAVLKGVGYAVACVSLAALPIAIATGTLLWSQMPIAAWVAWTAATTGRVSPEPAPARQPT